MCVLVNHLGEQQGRGGGLGMEDTHLSGGEQATPPGSVGFTHRIAVGGA